jgi:hypothetical protein
VTTDYAAFIASKALTNPPAGFTVPDAALNPMLFPFQHDIVRWALRRGKACIFADCGLGKTPMQLEWARHVSAHAGGPVLILAPLAVATQTQREGQKFGVPVTVCRAQADVQPGVNVTNYEMLHAFDPPAFAGVVLDESSILKSYDGAMRTMILDAFAATPYRLACTATPAPNDWMELGNHAEFVGSMSRTEMLSMFFTHDGGETQKWRLKGHATQDFWRWVCSWAVMLKRPSDLGYDDTGFDLPEMVIVHHTVESDHAAAESRGRLFNLNAHTLDERRESRRSTIGLRVDELQRIVAADPGAWLIWCNLNAEADASEAAIFDAVQVAGSDSLDVKVARMAGFTAGEHRVMVSKPSIAGFGMNWQHCHNVAFVGLSDSYEQFYQAVRRCYRFGQQHTVTVHIITADTDAAVVANIRRKEQAAQTMNEEMIRNMADLSAAELHGTARVTATHDTAVARGPSWELRLGDCCEQLATLATDSIHYSIFSPPFASLYTYTNSDHDMGNCKTHDEFYEHFRFLVPELLRVTMPGRLLSFHCMNLPTSKVRDGLIGLRDFRGELIRLFVNAGWIYHSEVVIWKDPVTAMQRTKALGLLHKQLKKDSCMSRQGVPDYLVTMRKPGDNPERVAHTNASFPVAVWQRYASPVWMDVNPTRTLQFAAAREESDERHIAPLQLDVIERGIDLWTNPGDTVLSPFAGIGSEGYVALHRGRKFLGIELKRSYWELACKHLSRAETEAKKATLFDLP